ncbi:MAG: DUF3035 domain-containing protein [Pseudomonadota bacterium]|nr:DUF3035 domain-containing protein [Pseudomonadota bacterium]
MKYLRHTALVGTLFLAACSGNTVKTSLGLDRAAPDEFRVVSRPPLSVPPQFELRPPATTDDPNRQAASQQAEALMTGNGNGSLDANTAVVPVTMASADASAANASESAFLRDAGADKADPKIRETLVGEQVSRQQQQQDSSWVDSLTTNPPKKDPIVNPKQEAARIKTDEAEGKPVTEGDTPTVKPQDTGILGNILGN